MIRAPLDCYRGVWTQGIINMALTLRQLLYRNYRGLFIPNSSSNTMFLLKAAASKFRGIASKPTVTPSSSPLQAPLSQASVVANPPGVVPFDESINIARIRDEDGDHFQCDEEPFMLGVPYAPGYMPIQFGTILVGEKAQYKVLRKLGWGTTSSVWLAQRVESSDESFVAIKVLTCSGSAAIFQEFNYELVAFASMDLDTKDHPGKAFCVRNVETFATDSEHGGHLCIVTEPYAVFLPLTRELPVKGFVRSPFAKTVIKQVLLALDFFHSLGFVHTDIKADNLLIPLSGHHKDIAAWLKDYPSSTYPPRNEPALWPVPIVTSKTEPIPPLGLTSPEGLVVHLADYGSSIPVFNITPGMCAMPTILRAPEIILEHTWGKPVDVWAVGCLTLELLTGQPIFNIDRTDDLSFTDVHLARIAELAGPFPPQFLEACKRRADFFGSAGDLLRPHSLPLQSSITDRLASTGLCGEELAGASDFILRALTIDPSKRPSASDLLADKWLQSGGFEQPPA
ncbi:hypothetical protein HGRIS_007063 [Hohenbuehelia grisea]|uniref:non-specific serine/threonine protein kinase n=1 Tax=Hohenbuehelia grisea TaxID=104357 RepID=A0ABR3JBN4_9AGAR